HKITDVFVTHTHIDHFIGFDRLLRVMLRRDRPLRIYGPAGITGSVEGKLRGYTWNLIEEYPVSLVVHEVTDASVSVSAFSARDGFRKRRVADSENSGVLLKDPLFSVKAACLRHDIAVLGFCVEEDVHINIDKAALTGKGLPVGPWLSGFKQAVREGREDFKAVVGGREYSMRELEDIVRITEGQKVSYVMDVSPSEENIGRVVELVRGSHVLYIETYFLDEDRERAFQRNHLTARVAGEIAREAGVGEIIPMHISPKYRTFPDRVTEEAMRAFKGG
ncbi:MAG: ribonuclease Z, partial [Nitrospirae bacterium]|nr:ribonuclease Z [Nitrospirota bacterium]